MAPQAVAHDHLTAHRVAALASQTLMRTTNAEIHLIVERTRNAIDDSRGAIDRADALLRAINDWILHHDPSCAARPRR
jgi:hypothetical protein